MDGRKHVYYITASDIQRVTKETIGRRLDQEELERVVEKLSDRVEWYQQLEYTILEETKSLR